MHRYREQIGGYQKGRGLRMGERGKEDKLHDDGQYPDFGGDHFVVYTNVKL